MKNYVYRLLLLLTVLALAGSGEKKTEAVDRDHRHGTADPGADGAVFEGSK